MTTDNFGFYLQNRLRQTSQTGGQWYSDTSPFSIPWILSFVSNQHQRLVQLNPAQHTRQMVLSGCGGATSNALLSNDFLSNDVYVAIPP
jgi:hypothetical protein